MKKWLVYIITCCVLLALLVVANWQIDELEEQSQFWQDEHTSLEQHQLEREVVWEGERTQWQDDVDSRDEIISWWENQPPDIVEKVVEVSVEVKSPVYPQRFTDKVVAEEWVLSHTLPVVIIADRANNLVNPAFDPRYDCDDYADDYETLALSESISLWQAPVTNGRIWGVKVSNTTGNHVGLWTKIDGVFYYVEPQPIADQWRFVKIMEAD